MLYDIEKPLNFNKTYIFYIKNVAEASFTSIRIVPPFWLTLDTQ